MASKSSSKYESRALIFVIATLITLLVVRILISVTSREIESSAASGDSPDGGSQWPDYLVSQAELFTKRPTNTTEAAELNWKKID